MIPVHYHDKLNPFGYQSGVRMITAACETCGRTFRLKDSMAGRTGRCPCGTAINVPFRESEPIYDTERAEADVEAPFVYVPSPAIAKSQRPLRAKKKGRPNAGEGLRVAGIAAAIAVVALVFCLYETSGQSNQNVDKGVVESGPASSRTVSDAKKMREQAEADLAEARRLGSQAENIRNQADGQAQQASQLTQSEAMDNDPFISRVIDRYPELRGSIKGDIPDLDARCQLMVATGILTARQSQYIREFSAGVQKLPR